MSHAKRKSTVALMRAAVTSFRAPLKIAFWGCSARRGRAASAMDALVHEDCEHPSLVNIAMRCAPQSEFLELPFSALGSLSTALSVGNPS